MSVQEPYDEANDPIVKWLGPRFSLNHIIRQVNCNIASTMITDIDYVRCFDLRYSRRKSITYDEGNETVSYFV